jgi:hypothetical protein
MPAGIFAGLCAIVSRIFLPPRAGIVAPQANPFRLYAQIGGDVSNDTIL